MNKLPPKTIGLCTICHRECYEILETFADGTPRRVGKMLDCGMQVEFILSDNSEMAITLCGICASKDLGEYAEPIMETVREGWEKEIEKMGWDEEKRRDYMKKYALLRIMGVARFRKEDKEKQLFVVREHKWHGNR